MTILLSNLRLDDKTKDLLNRNYIHTDSIFATYSPQSIKNKMGAETYRTVLRALEHYREVQAYREALDACVRALNISAPLLLNRESANIYELAHTLAKGALGEQQNDN